MNRRSFVSGFAIVPFAILADDVSPAAVVTQLIERVFNQRDFDAIDEFVAVDYVSHASDDAPGREMFRIRRELADAQISQVVSNVEYVIDQIIEQGDSVAVRMRLTGESTSGGIVDILMMAFYRVQSGLITDQWALVDAEAALEQLA